MAPTPIRTGTPTRTATTTITITAMATATGAFGVLVYVDVYASSVYSYGVGAFGVWRFVY